jgi:hypothetical protein
MRHKISVTFTERKREGEIYTVVARATTPDGRIDEATGAVSLGSLKGDALANAFMKCETKSKRRVTLSICGLSVIDDSEIESTPGARRVSEAEIEKLEVIEKKISKDAQSPAAEPAVATVTNSSAPYTIPFGKFINKRLDEVPAAELSAYCSAVVEDFATKKKTIGGRVAEFMDRAQLHLEESELP